MAADDEEAWIWSLSDPDDRGGYYPAGMREWLHETFLARGPIPASELEGLVLNLQMRLGQLACDAVAEDISRTLGWFLRIVTVFDLGSIRVQMADQVANAALSAMRDPELTVEVADAIQEEIMEFDPGYRVWPMCPEHAVGLHPELHKREAVWRCRFGDHVVAQIGQLGLA